MKTRTYTYPPEVEIQRLRARARRRRAALAAAGCATYELGLRGILMSVVCLCCGLGSSNAGDVGRKYCGFCHEFHSEEKTHDRQNES